MSNPFRHSICDACWKKRAPDRDPIRLLREYREQETCCFCGNDHRSGIYVRENPADMQCNGVHTRSA